MKLAMAMPPVAVGEKLQRRAEKRRAKKSAGRARPHSELGRAMGNVFRSVLVFLMVVSALLYLAANSDRFQTLTGQVATKLTTQANAKSTLRQGALQHEREVNEVTQ
jgi:hypothetical protein